MMSFNPKGSWAVLTYRSALFRMNCSSEKLQDLKSQIKVLEQKKLTLTDAAEIKAVNKQINALQVEFGRLRKEIQCRRSYELSVEREFVHCAVGDE